MENTYIYKQQKKLRCGYTTGTCAAAASMAAAAMLLGEEAVEQVSVETPGGVRFLLSVEEILSLIHIWAELRTRRRCSRPASR